MPIIDVTVVAPAEGALRQSFAREAADALGEFFEAAPGTVWVRVHVLPALQYAENITEQASTPRPAFVTVLQVAPASNEAMQEQAQMVCQAIAKLLAMPSDLVHVEYAPAANGRLFLGGHSV